jgi:hypothetical protein
MAQNQALVALPDYVEEQGDAIRTLAAATKLTK